MKRRIQDHEQDLGPSRARALGYAEQLRRLYLEQRATQAELEHKVRELEEAQAQLREYARDIGETYRRLQQTYIATLDSLALAVEQRDAVTGGHSHRVAHYARLLAQPFCLAPEETRALHYGSILHDIGKIGIPDAILNKPGELTEAEWAIMRRHPELGASMIEHVEFLAPALPIILSHHERWDGQGYPRGLQGDQIPLGSRIFQVADTLDAIVSDRPYRDGRELEVAVKEIRRHSAKQFDPAVVASLERLAPTLELLPASFGRQGPPVVDPID